VDARGGTITGSVPGVMIHALRTITDRINARIERRIIERVYRLAREEQARRASMAAHPSRRRA
jgi:hypothetical protein